MDWTSKLARSPDLTILDYFLWSYIKNIVYQTVSMTPENIKRRLIDVCIKGNNQSFILEIATI